MPDLRITDLRVGEAMTQDYGLVDHNTPVETVVELILKNHWGEVIVVDDEKKFVCLVTRETLVRTITNGLPQDVPIKSLCSRDIITTTEDEDLARARDIMRMRKIGRLPVIRDGGEVVGLLTARDVCNGFSSKLEMLGEHMYSVLENIAEAIQVIDCDGRVSFWNTGAEKMFGIAAQEIVGCKLADYFPDDLLLKVISNMQCYQNVLTELDDGVYIVRNAVPVVFSDGAILGAVCTNLDVSHIRKLIDNLERAQTKVRKLERIIGTQDLLGDEQFYTVNQDTRHVLQQAKRVAGTDATVLIQGESGTGKEIMAQVIYNHSKRAKQPYIEINCSAIPENLFESEMFGYESGSFTGAHRAGKAGKFELANGGTLFLDEIGELPMDMQAKLLRVLQERRFYRVGGTTPITADVRIIAATNRNMAELVEQKLFRSDLYYRLSVVVLEIPPLRERKDDIPGLTRLFLRKLGMEYGRQIKGIDREVMRMLEDYHWPGNVRQLQNLLESVVILMEDDYVTPLSLEEAGVIDVLRGPGKTAVSHSQREVITTTQLDNLMDHHEREAITKALQQTNYNKAKAAHILGIPRSTLYYKMKALNIEGKPSQSDMKIPMA
ncbi:MAG TPA: sigma-54-dependent Fis family transcriptional regulator [Syntrophomonas sp.]|jgi:PAS domain S-box-containing protein|nr:sigma-54-dependent Fis family transcriptional regulator [Syntrophomonas sp.]